MRAVLPFLIGLVTGLATIASLLDVDLAALRPTVLLLVLGTIGAAGVLVAQINRSRSSLPLTLSRSARIRRAKAGPAPAPDPDPPQEEPPDPREDLMWSLFWLLAGGALSIPIGLWIESTT
jgi:hypothetical protein